MVLILQGLACAPPTYQTPKKQASLLHENLEQVQQDEDMEHLLYRRASGDLLLLRGRRGGERLG